MTLIWSDPQPPTEGVSSYTHVIAETPLGFILLEWKSWKDTDEPCGHMPWDEFVEGDTLELAKIAAQRAWDEMAPKVMALSSLSGCSDKEDGA